MEKFIRILCYSFFVFFVSFFLMEPYAHATSVSVTGKAGVLNTANSYLDFSSYNSNATIDSTTGDFSGYAFLEDVGWIAFGTTDNSVGPVNLNLTTGVVTGKAKSLTTGALLDFNSYSSNVTATIPQGVFSGYVFSEDVGWINFADTGVSTTTSFDNTAPSISLTSLTPDPSSDTTPTLSGTATESTGTVSNVQFQVDSTSGSWSSCSASDGSFNSTSETFSCTTSTLTDGSHTMYVRATDSNSNTTGSGSYASDTFTIDTTAPVSFDLDSPGNNSYTNNERPSFKWKTTTDATAGLSKYVLEIDNPSIGSSEPSGDFTIDAIPTSRTTDYETNKYLIHYENFSDSDSNNDYISVYTKSHSDWSSNENDGKLREGKVSWKVKAVDSSGNETSSSRSLFVDRTNPNVEFNQINDASFSTQSFQTTDKKPTIFGKITDPLAGGDSSKIQSESGPKVASAPKEVNIKVEKKTGLTYELVTLYKINMDNPYYTCDSSKTIDNNNQKCDKYLPFTYTPEQNLDLGTYKITLTGKDKANNSSTDSVFILDITTFTQITTPEEKQIVEEQLKNLKPQEKQKIKEEIEITKPIEPNVIEKTSEGISQITSTVENAVRQFFQNITNKIASSINFLTTRINNQAVKNTKNGIANFAFSIGEKTDDISHELGTFIIKIGYLFVPEPTTITNVKVAKSTRDSMTIAWETNHPASGKVNYGLTPDYGQDIQLDKRTTHHEFTISGLKPGTTYHYEVMSQNRNYVYDANHTFTTPAK